MKNTMLVLMAMIITMIFSFCKKDEPGVQRLYKCSCSGKTLDWEFGGYDTYTNDTSNAVMADSYDDAKKKCDQLDFKLGEEYQDCAALY